MQILSAISLLFIFSIVFIGMGLLALYIGNIHTEILKDLDILLMNDKYNFSIIIISSDFSFFIEKSYQNI